MSGSRIAARKDAVMSSVDAPPLAFAMPPMRCAIVPMMGSTATPPATGPAAAPRVGVPNRAAISSAEYSPPAAWCATTSQMASSFSGRIAHGVDAIARRTCSRRRGVSDIGVTREAGRRPGVRARAA
jgi:hypothetical protein